MRLLKRTVDIFKPYAPEVQIGDKIETITSIAAHQAELIEYKLPEQKLDILSLAKKTASSLIKAGFRGHVIANDSEICIMDTDNIETAQKVWRFNLGGFGYSDTGYDGIYRTAMTMNGEIVADFITAGVLRGIEISNGDGTFHVAPDGTVEASNLNVRGGKIDVDTGDANESIIAVKSGANGTFVRPSGIMLHSAHNNNSVVVGGTQISGYSYFAGSDSERTYHIDSESGNFTTQGVVYAEDLVFKRGENYYSVESILASLTDI